MAISNARNGYINGTTSGWVARSLFNVGDTLYAVVLNTSAVLIEVHKSTDGGVTWTEQDSGDSLAHSGATHSYDANMPLSGSEAGFIYVAYRTASTTVRVRRFDTSTDTWEATDLGSANASTVVQSDFGMGLVVRSNGDVVILYRNSTNQDTYITKYESGAWSISTVRTTATTVALCATMTANSDMAHLMIHETTNGDVHHRSVDSGSSLGTIGTLDATSITTIWYSSFMGYVNDGGTHRLGFANWDSTGELDFLYTTSSATPTFTTVGALSPTSTTDPGKMGGTVVGYNGQWHVIWSGNGRGSIHYDVSDDYASPAFGTDTTPVTGLANDPAVYAIAAPTGVPVLYTNHTTPSVDLFWAAGAPASTGATGTVSADTVPVVGGSVTGTAGTGATGTVTGDTVAVTGGSVTGSADAVVDATGTVSGDTIPVAYGSITATAGTSATGTITSDTISIAYGSVTATTGAGDSATITADTVPITGGSVTGASGALGTVTGDTVPLAYGTVTATAGTSDTGTVSGDTIPVTGGSITVTAGALGTVSGSTVVVVGQTVTGNAGSTVDATGVVNADTVPITGGTVAGTAEAIATVTGDVVPISGDAVTGTAGTSATGTVSGSTVVITGGVVTGTAGTSVDATGTVSADTIPVAGASVTATTGAGDSASATADTIPVTGGTITGTADALGSVTVGAVIITGGTVLATAGQAAAAIVSGSTVVISGGTVTGEGYTDTYYGPVTFTVDSVAFLAGQPDSIATATVRVDSCATATASPDSLAFVSGRADSRATATATADSIQS
jgi:hypothetical protein